MFANSSVATDKSGSKYMGRLECSGFLVWHASKGAEDTQEPIKSGRVLATALDMAGAAEVV